jgi:hypothetical protein
MAISKASRAGRRGWSQRESKHVKLIDHIITVEVDSPGRGGHPGRTTTRDFIVPARPRTRKTELLWLIKERRGQDDLLKRERYAVGLLNVPGRKITIAEGPVTRGKKVKLR